MNAHKVIVRKMKRDRSFKILQLFRYRIPGIQSLNEPIHELFYMISIV